MEPVTYALFGICAVLIGVIIWLVIRKWSALTPQGKTELAERGLELVRYLKTAYSNDGKLDAGEIQQIMTYLVGIVSYLSGVSETAVKIQTGTEELLEKQE